MTKFNYKKWITENKYGKQPHLFEQDDKLKKDRDNSEEDSLECPKGARKNNDGCDCGQGLQYNKRENTCDEIESDEDDVDVIDIDDIDDDEDNVDVLDVDDDVDDVYECIQEDFNALNGECGAKYLKNSNYQEWLDKRWDSFQTSGCNHLQNTRKWLKQQLQRGTTSDGVKFTQLQRKRKRRKRKWAKCMLRKCRGGSQNGCSNY